MPDFDSDTGQSLREAIMEAGSPLLASLAQKRLEVAKQPSWWMPQLAPEPLPARRIEYDVRPDRDYELTAQAIETAFRLKLIAGELVCWARPGAPHESHKKLPRGAWGSLVVEDWIFGTLRAGTRDARMDFVAVPDGLRYYAARIVSPDHQRERNKGGSPGHPRREAAIAAATEYLLDEGDESKPDAIGRTVVFLRDWFSENDEGGGPSSRKTLNTWAEEAVKRAVDTKRP